MGHNAEEWRRLRSEFIEAAAQYDEYETFIKRTSESEDFYCNNGRYQTVGLVRWPYGRCRKCWILAPDSGENADPFSTMKTLFSKAWLWLPRDIANRVVDTAEIHLSEPPSPPDDRVLWWAKSYYQYWCWLLWFHWLRQQRAANPTEAKKPSKTMVMSPFHCSADLIAQWGLDGSKGEIPDWLALEPDAGIADIVAALKKLQSTGLKGAGNILVKMLIEGEAKTLLKDVVFEAGADCRTTPDLFKWYENKERNYRDRFDSVGLRLKLNRLTHEIEVLPKELRAN